jgi:hypothetical protein
MKCIAPEYKEMDRDIKTDRKKKSDKAKEKYDRTGGYSQKHVRLAEALAEKTASSRQSKSQEKK